MLYIFLQRTKILVAVISHDVFTCNSIMNRVYWIDQPDNKIITLPCQIKPFSQLFFSFVDIAGEIGIVAAAITTAEITMKNHDQSPSSNSPVQMTMMPILALTIHHAHTTTALMITLTTGIPVWALLFKYCCQLSLLFYAILKSFIAEFQHSSKKFYVLILSCFIEPPFLWIIS